MAHPAQSIRLLLVLCLGLVSTTCHASESNDAGKPGDHVQIGHGSITIAEDQQAGDIVCVGCSIRVAGMVHDAVVVGGRATVDGTVRGDLVVVGGGVILGENAVIDGDVVTVGGQLHRHPNARIHGDVSAPSGFPVMLALVLVPLIPIILIVALVVWLVSPNRRRRPAPVYPAR